MSADSAALSLNIANQVLATVKKAAVPAPNFNRAGIIAVAAASTVSAIAVLLLLLHTLVTTTIHLVRKHEGRPLATTHLGLFIILLFVGLLVSSAGGAFDWMWVMNTRVNEMACTTQALLLQFGNLSTALLVLFITLHTFNAIVLRKRLPRWGFILAIVVLYSVSFTLDFIGPVAQQSLFTKFYGPAVTWCWIVPKNSGSIMALVSAPMMIASVLSFILYAAIFIFTRRRMMSSMRGGPARPGSRASRRTNRTTGSTDTYSETGAWFVASRLVWYPAVYILFASPLAFSLLAQVKSEGVLIFAGTLYSLLGAALVVVYVLTFRVFGGQSFRLGLGSVTLQGTQQKLSSESFVALEKKISPPSPLVLQPTEREWQAPADRTPRASMSFSRRGSVSTVHTVTDRDRDAPEVPLPPMPLGLASEAVVADNWANDSIGRARSHRRMQSDLGSTRSGPSSITLRPEPGTVSRQPSATSLRSNATAVSNSNAAYSTFPGRGNQQQTQTQPGPSRQRSVGGPAPLRPAPPPADTFAEFGRSRTLRQQPSLGSMRDGRPLRTQPALDAPPPPVAKDEPVAPAPVPVPVSLPSPPPMAAREAPPAPAPTEEKRASEGRLRRADSMAALAAALDFTKFQEPAPMPPAGLAPSPAPLRAPSPAPSMLRAPSPAPSAATTLRAPSPGPGAPASPGMLTVPKAGGGLASPRRVPVPALLEIPRAGGQRPTSGIESPLLLDRPVSEEFDVPTPVREALAARFAHRSSDGSGGSAIDRSPRAESILGYYGAESPVDGDEDEESPVAVMALRGLPLPARPGPRPELVPAPAPAPGAGYL